MQELYYTVVILTIVVAIIALPLVFGQALHRWENTSLKQDYIAGIGFIAITVVSVSGLLLVIKSFYEVFK